MGFIEKISNSLFNRTESQKFAKNLRNISPNRIMGESYLPLLFKFVIGRDPTFEETLKMDSFDYTSIDFSSPIPFEEAIISNVLGRHFTETEKKQMKEAKKIIDSNNSWLTRDCNLSTRNQMDGGR
jgi:hypothetical protein